ncbi:MAG: undecaprenyl-diphosphatase UppP [Thermaceae bacterium]
MVSWPFVSTWEAVLLGVVEGLTEFLPVSSTGHLTLLAHILGLDLEHDPFLKSFVISIQLGAILAVLLLYWRRFLRDLEAWRRILVAFLPTALVGFTLYRLIKDVILGKDWVVVLALFFVGLLLLWSDRALVHRARYQDLDELPLKAAFWVGVFQSLAALIPGTSRSGITILGGLVVGLRRKAAAEMSFLLAVPTMLAATGYDLLKSAHTFPERGYGLLALGFFSALLTAALTVRLMLALVERLGFAPFAYYRMVLALVYALVFMR